MPKDHKAQIISGLDLLTKLVESDTEVSSIDLNLLENLNTNQSLNYIKLEQHLNCLENNAKKYEKLRTEFNKYSDTLARIEEEVGILESITKDMDRFSKDLESQIES